MLSDDEAEQMMALAAAIARYQMALEAVTVCTYDSDQAAIAAKALERPSDG